MTTIHFQPDLPALGHTDGLIIAIDGPAGSGKSSTARVVASRLGYRHLDSGAFYRALTLAALRQGIPVDHWLTLDGPRLEALGVDVIASGKGFRVMIGGEDVTRALRERSVSKLVPRMAAGGEVRSWLLRHLREAGARGGLVADGRDIGTVVFPDAELKIFLIADPAERARRRLREHGSEDPSEDEVREEMLRLSLRDTEDSTRAVAPLARAADAVTLDTTALEFEAQVLEIVRLAKARGG